MREEIRRRGGYKLQVTGCRVGHEGIGGIRYQVPVAWVGGFLITNGGCKIHSMLSDVCTKAMLSADINRNENDIG